MAFTTEATVAGSAVPPSSTVLGLGSMGTALAQAFVAAGAPTTVWNRTAGRAEPLAALGATVASTAANAISASDLVVVCLRDHAAFRQLFGFLGSLPGRLVVHLSSATPTEARATAAWAAERGIDYLNGAIMVPTPLIGTEDAQILYSGDEGLYRGVAGRLAVLGKGDFLGTDPGLASLHDVAILEVFFAGMTSFLHAVALTSAHGLSASRFLPYAQQIAQILPDTFSSLAAQVDRAEYPGDEDNLAMELAALDHIVTAGRSAGLDGRLAEAMRDLALATVSMGHGARGFSAVVEALRQGPRSSTE